MSERTDCRVGLLFWKILMPTSCARASSNNPSSMKDLRC